MALALGAALAVGGGCDDWKPPQAPPVAAIPAYPDPTARPPRPAPKLAPASAFAALRDRILDQWLADDPSLGRGAGLHQYDGKVGDYSAAGIAARLARIEKQRAELAAVDPKALSPDEALDSALLLQRADMTLFHGRDLDVFRRSPQAYEDSSRSTPTSIATTPPSSIAPSASSPTRRPPSPRSPTSPGTC